MVAYPSRHPRCDCAQAQMSNSSRVREARREDLGFVGVNFRNVQVKTLPFAGWWLSGDQVLFGRESEEWLVKVQMFEFYETIPEDLFRLGGDLVEFVVVCVAAVRVVKLERDDGGQ